MEKLLRGLVFFYGESPQQTGLRDGRVVLQLHSALDLLYHGPVCEGVRVLERRPAVHGVLLLGEV